MSNIAFYQEGYTDGFEDARKKYERPQVAYLCKYHKEPHYCKHTTRIEDALNFVKLEDGKYMESERPQGEWIKIKRSLGDGKHCTFIYRCPFCGYVEGTKANFCGNCGAEMVGGEL